jgi:uncharacterized protein
MRIRLITIARWRLTRPLLALSGAVLGVLIMTYVIRHSTPLPRPEQLSNLTASNRECKQQFPNSQRVINTLRNHQPLTIAIVGDSFAEGIEEVLRLPAYQAHHWKIIRLAKSSTGFVRTYDLIMDIQQLLLQKPPDIVIVDFGANDPQGMIINGHYREYMSSEWQAAIKARIRAFILPLQYQHTSVAWIGSPSMATEKYDLHMQQMNKFISTLASEYGFRFIDPRLATLDAQGLYQEMLFNPTYQRAITVRAKDGIHMSVYGYQLISQQVLREISEFETGFSDGPLTQSPLLHSLISVAPITDYPAGEPATHCGQVVKAQLALWQTTSADQ